MKKWFQQKKQIKQLHEDSQALRQLYAETHVRNQKLEEENYKLRREVDKYHRELVTANRTVKRKSDAVKLLRSDKEQILKEGSENWLKRMDNYRKHKRAEAEKTGIKKLAEKHA